MERPAFPMSELEVMPLTNWEPVCARPEQVPASYRTTKGGGSSQPTPYFGPAALARWNCQLHHSSWAEGTRSGYSCECCACCLERFSSSKRPLSELVWRSSGALHDGVLCIVRSFAKYRVLIESSTNGFEVVGNRANTLCQLQPNLGRREKSAKSQFDVSLAPT